MANLHDVKPVTISITLRDGVERNLRFTLNALAELEDHFGDLDTAFKKLNDGKIKDIRFALWVALVDDDETLTERHVGSLIDVGNLPSIMDSLTRALDEDMPQDESQAAPSTKVVPARAKVIQADFKDSTDPN